MAWAKVDDGWWCHPKVLGLSLEAKGLWVTALSWSCQQRRDVVPDRFVYLMGQGGAPEAFANELERAGLWVRVDDGWRIHDWDEYQERSLSEKRAEAGQRGGVRSGEIRREANPKQDEATERSNRQANAEAGTRPGPSQPDPSRKANPGRADKPRPKTSPKIDPEVWDALTQVFGEPSTKTERSQLAKAGRELQEVAATGEEILERAREAWRRWQGTSFSPQALCKHWTSLAIRAGPSRNGKRGSLQAIDDLERLEVEAHGVRGLEADRSQAPGGVPELGGSS